jgi:hypothetical protein
MLPIHIRIGRAQRLLRMLENDAPLLAIRVKDLAPEQQNAATNYAARLTEKTRSEIEKLLREKSAWVQKDFTPQAAD